jgi:hypothetical protein
VTELSEAANPETRPVAPADSAAPGPRAAPIHRTCRIFIGADGIRAGWSMLLFAAIFLGLISATSHLLLHLLVEHRNGAPHSTAQSQAQPKTPRERPIEAIYVFRQEGFSLLCVLIATWIMALIERRPVTAYGFARSTALRNFTAGLAWGVACSRCSSSSCAPPACWSSTRACSSAPAPSLRRWSGSPASCWSRCSRRSSPAAICSSRSPAASAAISTAGSSTASAAPTRLGFWTAALFSPSPSASATAPTPASRPSAMLSAGLIGLVFCLSLWRTGSLWWAIGFHAAWDWAQSFLYGVADSGMLVQGRLFATHPVGRPSSPAASPAPRAASTSCPSSRSLPWSFLLTLPRTHRGYIPTTEPSAL